MKHHLGTREKGTLIPFHMTSGWLKASSQRAAILFQLHTPMVAVSPTAPQSRSAQLHNPPPSVQCAPFMAVPPFTSVTKPRSTGQSKGKCKQTRFPSQVLSQGGTLSPSSELRIPLQRPRFIWAWLTVMVSECQWGRFSNSATPRQISSRISSAIGFGKHCESSTGLQRI